MPPEVSPTVVSVEEENSMREEEMKNISNSIPSKKPIRTMFGNLKTQAWARKAFPILVNRAQNGQIITFKELAEDHFGVRGY